MRRNGLCILCTLLICSTAVLAEVTPTPTQRDVAKAQTEATAVSQSNVASIQQAFVEKGETWVAGDTLRDANRPGAVQCPEPYLCGQDDSGTTWLYSDMAFCYSGNCGRITSDQFPPPREALLTKPVGIVSFTGTYIDDSGSGCTKADSFRICFYTDDGTGKPILPANTCFANQVPVSVVEDGNINFGGADVATKYRFTVVLPSVVNVQSTPYNGKGIFSVSHDGGVTGCWFLLGPSAAPEGNGQCYRWYDSNPAGTIASNAYDIQYCFAENKQGACCDDCDALNCISASNQFLCNQLGWRFEENKICSTMDPPCGEATGACCHDDGTCQTTTCAACTAPGAYWAGGGTSCADCCVIVCTNTENEPTCGPGYVDVTNPGCNGDTPAFSAIGCGATLCGESGTYETSTATGCVGDANCDGVVSFADINPFVTALLSHIYCDGTGFNDDVSVDTPTHVGFEDINPFVALLTQNPLPITCPTSITPPGETTQYRDMDWYQYTTTQPYTLTFTVDAEFEARIWITANQGAAACTDECDYAYTASGPKCTDLTIETRCLPAGTYYFIVAPNTFEGVACGSDYQATLTCTPCEPCTYVCDPNAPGYQAENEACGLGNDVNGGCGDPNTGTVDRFTDVTFTAVPAGSKSFYATICAELYAGEVDPNTGGQYRDLDWYRYDLPTVADVTFTVQTEIPLIMTPLFDENGGVWYCGAPLYGYWDRHQDPCNELAPLITTIPNGINYIFVAPEFADGSAMFEGYPCCAGDNTYILSLSYTIPDCPTMLACGDNPSIAENEPACYDGYVDNYDGGCDAGAPGPMIALPGFECDWYICGSSAAYHQASGDPNSPIVYDADWYTFSLAAPSYLCIEGLTELPIDVNIYGPNPSCDPNAVNNLDAKVIFNGFYAACAGYDQDPIDPDPNTPAREMAAAGNYWMRIGLRPGFDDVTCGLNWEYYITMTCASSCADTK